MQWEKLFWRFWLAKEISCGEKKIAESNILVSSSMYYLLLLFALDLLLYEYLTETFSSYNDCCNQWSILGFFENSVHSNVPVCLSRGSPALAHGQVLIKKKREERVPEAVLLLSWACPCTPRGVLAPHPSLLGWFLPVPLLSELGPKWQSRSWCQAHKKKSECAMHVTIFSFSCCSGPCNSWYKLGGEKKLWLFLTKTAYFCFSSFQHNSYWNSFMYSCLCPKEILSDCSSLKM